MDWDDLCIEYDELVEAGEIDPKVTSLSDFMEDRVGEMIDNAMDSMDR